MNKLLTLTLIAPILTLTSCSDSGTHKSIDAGNNNKPSTTRVEPTKTNKETQNTTKPEKTIYLTFDDGPSIYTPEILKILKQYNAKATFFNMGINAKRYPQYEKMVIDNGDTIGNHSYNHPDFRTLSSTKVKQQLSETNSIISKNIGKTPECMRPPYGSTSKRINNIITTMGMRVMLWDSDSRDWSKPGIKQIVHNALLNHHDKTVILFHDGGGNRKETIEALPIVLKTLQGEGYTLKNPCS